MVQPFSLKDAPALIEVALPVQKLSAEAQKERKAGAGQTLTALGSYWKGRKPLILAKACILGCLLPATGNTAKDIEIFEKLMGIDDDAFAIRANLKADTIVRTISLDDIDPLKVFRFNRPKGEEPTQFPYRDEVDENLSLYGSLKVAWKPKVPKATKVQLQKRTLKNSNSRIGRSWIFRRVQRRLGMNSMVVFGKMLSNTWVQRLTAFQNW